MTELSVWPASWVPTILSRSTRWPRVLRTICDRDARSQVATRGRGRVCSQGGRPGPSTSDDPAPEPPTYNSDHDGRDFPSAAFPVLRNPSQGRSQHLLFDAGQLQDSGLDVDALRTVAKGVTRLKGQDMSVLVITHYPRILEYLKPDRVHILHHGRVITSGGPELAGQIEREGYEPIIGPVAAEAGASRTSLTGVVAEAHA